MDMARPVRRLSLEEMAATTAEGQETLPGFQSALVMLPVEPGRSLPLFEALPR
jgi:hypothetical protein